MFASITARAATLGTCLLAVTPASAATPDISGPWMIVNPHGALQPDGGGAAPLRASARIATAKADPIAGCLPPGVPRLFLQKYPFNIVQGHTMYAMMFEWNHLNRIIHLTDKHIDTIGPLYLGHSIGHWDGNTLVVDTTSYNDKTWLDDTGLPNSDQLHTVEHISLISSGKQLLDQVTIDDPKIYSSEWTTTLVFRKDPVLVIKEDYCLGRVGKAQLAVIKQ